MRLPKQSNIIFVLVFALFFSSAWWTYRLVDNSVTQSRVNASLESRSEALAQSLRILPMVAGGATREEVIAAALAGSNAGEPFEKEGFVWIGGLGLRFDEQGKLVEAIAPTKANGKAK